MTSQIDIRSELAEFRSSRHDLRLAAFVDVSSCMVLGTSSRVTRNQEMLDGIARDTSRALSALAAAPCPTAEPVFFLVAGEDEIRAIIAPDTRSDEALVFCLDPAAEIAGFHEDAARFASRIFGIGGAALP